MNITEKSMNILKREDNIFSFNVTCTEYLCLVINFFLLDINTCIYIFMCVLEIYVKSPFSFIVLASVSNTMKNIFF